MRTIVPLFLTVSSPDRLTELRSTLGSFPSNKIQKYWNGNGLDINCWTGETTKELQTKFPDICFYGVDKNKHAIDVAKKRYSKEFFRTVNLENESVEYKDLYRIVHVSKYDHLPTMLQRAYLLLEEEGMMIVRYQEKDFDYLKKMYERYRSVPELSNPMYLFPESKKAIFFK